MASCLHQEKLIQRHMYGQQRRIACPLHQNDTTWPCKGVVLELYAASTGHTCGQQRRMSCPLHNNDTTWPCKGCFFGTLHSFYRFLRRQKNGLSAFCDCALLSNRNWQKASFRPAMHRMCTFFISHIFRTLLVFCRLRCPIISFLRLTSAPCFPIGTAMQRASLRPAVHRLCTFS